MGRFFYPIVFIIALNGFLLGCSVATTFFNPVKYTVSLVIGSSLNTADQRVDEKSNESQKERRFCEDYGFWKRTYCDPTAFFTGFLALFTALLTMLTGGLWIAALSALKESRTNGQAQVRAYLHVVDVQVLEHGMKLPRVISRYGGDVPFKAQVVFKNAGQSPARNVIINMRVKTVERERLEIFDRAAKGGRQEIIPSVAAQGQFSMRIDNILSGDEFICLRTDKCVCVILIEFNYLDVFKIRASENYVLVSSQFGRKDARFSPI